MQPMTPIPALQVALASFTADPVTAQWNTAEDIGGCWNASHAFAVAAQRFGVTCTFRRFVNLPGMRTDRQHAIEADGLIIDWTARQHDPSAPFPLVEPFADYLARGFVPADDEICPTCGNGYPGHDCHGLKDDPGWYAQRALTALLKEMGLS